MTKEILILREKPESAEDFTDRMRKAYYVTKHIYPKRIIEWDLNNSRFEATVNMHPWEALKDETSDQR